MSALVHPAGSGERHQMGASSVVIKATAQDTAGAFFIAEVTLAAGFPGPPPHFHERLHETLYVLKGELTMVLGDRVDKLGPGAFISIPPRTAHTFRNDGSEPAVGLNINAPAGWEQYLRELVGAANSGSLTQELMTLIASMHDFHPVT